MVTFFLGGAAGSALAAYAWQHWRWAGVCAVGTLMPLVATINMLAMKCEVEVRSLKSEAEA